MTMFVELVARMLGLAIPTPGSVQVAVDFLSPESAVQVCELKREFAQAVLRENEVEYKQPAGKGLLGNVLPKAHERMFTDKLQVRNYKRKVLVECMSESVAHSNLRTSFWP